MSNVQLNALNVLSYLQDKNTTNSQLAPNQTSSVAQSYQTDRVQLASVNRGKDIPIEAFLYDAKASSRARTWGIKTASDFLERGKGDWGRWMMSKQLDLPKEVVTALVYRADLLRVSDVKLTDAFLLQVSGIQGGVPDLARQGLLDVGALYGRMMVASLQYGVPLPDFDRVGRWVNEARTLYPKVY